VGISPELFTNYSHLELFGTLLPERLHISNHLLALECRMTPHSETLSLIRQITEDGKITEDEVMDLGNFLNRNKEARRAWPGSVLFEVLKRIFDDAKVDQTELRALGFILKGIELQCSGTFAFGGGDVPEDGFPPETQVKHIGIGLPSLEFAVTVENTDGSGSHSVDLVNQLCDCEDFVEKRATFPTGSPGRMCKHMLFAVLDSAGEEQMKSASWHAAFVRVLNHLAEIDRPADRFPEWELLQAAEREWVLCFAQGEWAVVFTENAAGKMERYAYQITESRWAYGRVPIGARLLATYLNTQYDQNSARIPGL
jgi:hypothetical protein